MKDVQGAYTSMTGYWLRCDVGQVIQIGVLPDDVLLEIFDFYLEKRWRRGKKKDVEKWKSLVHVCRRWRSIVFRSPYRLDLKLFCTPKTPSKDTLDVWPACLSSLREIWL
jgi:F-box associated protein